MIHQPTNSNITILCTIKNENTSGMGQRPNSPGESYTAEYITHTWMRILPVRVVRATRLGWFSSKTPHFFLGIPNLPKVLVSAKAKLGQELQCHMVLDQNPMESFVVHPKIVVFCGCSCPKTRYFIWFWSVPLLYPSRTKRLNQHTGQASNLGVVALTKFDAARAKQEEKVEPVVSAWWGIWWAEKNVSKRLKRGMW